MANLDKSEPIHRLPSFSATVKVVPEPQKKSAMFSQVFHFRRLDAAISDN